MRVLVTGATGFVGTAPCKMLDRRCYAVRAARRVLQPLAGQPFDSVAVGEIGPSTDWNAALEACSCRRASGGVRAYYA